MAEILIIGHIWHLTIMHNYFQVLLMVMIIIGVQHPTGVEHPIITVVMKQLILNLTDRIIL